MSNIYHKNLKPVVYVTSDVAGRIESPVYDILEDEPQAIDRLALPEATIARSNTGIEQPFSTRNAA